MSAISFQGMRAVFLSRCSGQIPSRSTETELLDINLAVRYVYQESTARSRALKPNNWQRDMDFSEVPTLGTREQSTEKNNSTMQAMANPARTKVERIYR